MVDKSPYIRKLQEYFFRKYQLPLSNELALEYFEQLVTLIICIYRPIPDELDKVGKEIP